MRRAAAILAAVAVLAGCATPAPAGRDAEECLRLFRHYDRVEQRAPSAGRILSERNRTPPSELSRATQRLIVADCRTWTRDLDGMEAHAATLVDFRPTEGPTAMRRAPVHLGVVTDIADERRVTLVFRGLGYGSRGIGAPGLGRRLYVGPFTSEEGAAQAMELARAVGFIAPYVPRFTRF